jgi:alpha-glucosidase
VKSQQRWWQGGVVYQVYPRSFGDDNGDGVGDLAGICAHVDYLAWLGVDAVWLSPIYPSPMADFGYDVADHTAVDPLFGSLADLDRLIDDLHARDMRLLLDLVPNHTSDRHPWFAEARASRASPRRDWYIWRDPAADGGPPNAWQSEFGGSAWQLDERTGQYYFHSFLPEQPDLDWRNPQVRAQMAEAMRFWLRRGVDGFRIDVVWLLAKGIEIEPGPHAGSGGMGGDQPKVHDYIAELRAIADEFGDRLLIGEVYLAPERLVAYYGRNGRGLQLPFNFQLLLLPWRADALEPAISRYESLVPEDGWPNWVLGNHDQPRIATRVGTAQARVAAVLLLTLRGTPTLYYGDEIGMADVDVPRDAQRDPQGLNGGRSRDPSRTPMRWDGSPSGGFSSATPWLPIGPDLARVNVAAQRDDPDSLLTLYRRLLELRRAEPALSIGDCASMGAQGDAMSFVRDDGERRFLIALNLGPEPARYATEHRGRVLISTHAAGEGRHVGGTLELAPDEAFVALVTDD